MNTLNEQIEILIAFREGKKLQINYDDGYVDRESIDIPSFTLYEYKIKPEPLKIHVVVTSTNVPIILVDDDYIVGPQMLAVYPDCKVKKFIEVM